MKSSWPIKLLTSFFLVTTVGIVLYTMFAAFHYSSNAILGKDEANFIILSTQKILAATNLNDFVKSFFPSHGQHTLLGMQLVNLATLFSFGALDRRIMNVIGVFILCLAALLLPGRYAKGKVETILLYATLFPLILSPTHNACIVNASCTGNHYFGIAASVVALYFFTKAREKNRFFIGAEIFMILAIFSLPAALALAPISIVILLKNDKQNEIPLIGFHFALIFLMLLFHYYLTYPNTIFSFAQHPEASSLAQTAKEFGMFVLTFLVITGSMFYWLADMGYGSILVIVGVMVSIVIASYWLKAWKGGGANDSNFHFYGVLLFLIMILTISFGRYYSLGSSRYSAYTAFLYAMLLMMIYSRLDQSDSAEKKAHRIKILVCSSALSLAYFMVALHYHQPYLLELGQKDDACKQLWQNEHYVCGVMMSHEEATQIVRGAIDQGIYRIEK